MMGAAQAELQPKPGDRVVITRQGADMGRVATVRRVERILCGEPPVRGHIYSLRVWVLVDPRGDVGPERRQLTDSDLRVVRKEAF